MTDWLILGGYVAGYLLTYRKFYIILAESLPSADTGDRATAAVMAMMGCLVWPLVVVGLGVWHFLTPVTPSQRAAELEARERRIASLERELGIGEGGRH